MALVYVDEKMGLAEIAAKHGEAAVEMIPRLLLEGARVRDEALPRM